MIDSVPSAATFSKDPVFWGKLPFNYITSMDGARVKGDNGKWYLDWVCGLGANLLGQGYGSRHDGFVEHVNLFTNHGVASSLPHMMEYRAAEKLVHNLTAHVPGWSSAVLQVRWVLSGSDACSAALRLARAITGQMHYVNIGYHGWGDAFIAATPPAHGLPGELGKYALAADYGDMATLEKYGSEYKIAAIILEQPSVEPPEGYYASLRNWCNQHSALLIMDEIVTGLRYGLGGVCERYEVYPDLVCMGKALGNGYPIAAVVGPREYMDWFNPAARPHGDPVFVSSTNAGCVAGLAAVDYVLDHWKQKDIEKLWLVGGQLMTMLQHIGVDIIGHPPRSLLRFSDDYQRAYFIHRMAEQGVLMNRPNFVCAAHTVDNVQETTAVAAEVMQDMQQLGADGIRVAIGDDLPLVMFRNR